MSKFRNIGLTSLIDLLLLFLLAYMPLAFGAVALQWRAPAFVVAFVMGALALIASMRDSYARQEVALRHDMTVRKSPLIFMGLFLGLILIRLLSPIYPHPAPHKGWIAFFTYMTAFSVYFVITTQVAGRQRLKKIIFCIVSVSVFEAFYGLIEHVSKHQHIFFYAKRAYTEVATGTFINRNHYAAYLMMGLSLCMGMFLYNWSRRFAHRNKSHWKQGAAPKLAIIGFCLVMILAAIWSSESRAVPLMIIGALLLDRIPNRTDSKIEKFPVLLFGVIILAAVVFSIWLGISPINFRYAELIGDMEVADGRPQAYVTAWRAWLSAPILGHGAGVFEDLFFMFRTSMLKVFYDHAHNDYLEILAETGITGLFCFVAAIFWALANVFQKIKKRKSRFAKNYAWAATIGVLAMLLHGIVDFDFQIPANLTTFFAMLAVAQVAASGKFGD